MANIKDIAQAAGVSVSTVSNVLNGRQGRASVETENRVREAAATLGYTPSMLARSLVSSVSRLVGVITAFTEEENRLLLSNPFYAEAISGIEKALRENGYNMILVGAVPGGVDLTTFKEWNVDGLIVLGTYEDSLYEAVRGLGKPSLFIDSYVNGDHSHHLRLDDFGAAKSAAEYLLRRGHRQIALVGGALHPGGVVERRAKGFTAALQEAGVALREDRLHFGNVSFDWGREAAARIEADPGVTAVFCTADVIAAGVLAGLQAAGKSVPGDISVMGFDNLSISKMVYPGITTLDQRVVERGAIAARMVVDLIEGRPVESLVTTDAGIVERESVADLARSGS